MRLLLVSAWILIGTAAAGAVYWAFLNTPESTVWALAASAVLLLLALFVAGTTLAGAILLWTHGLSRRIVGDALRGSPAVIPALLIVLAVWWLAGHVETWIALRSGPINAWAMARLGMNDVSWLIAGVGYAVLWARWVVAGLLATWVVAAILHGAKHRLSPARVGLASLWFVALVALPWAYLVPWRPAGIPPTAMETAFIGGKLLVAAAIMSLGAALVIREATPRSRAS